MIKHIVMFKLKDFGEEEKLEKANQLKQEVESLKDKIPQIAFIEVGINTSARETAHDAILISEFKTKEDLNIYRDHPEHVKVVEFIRSIVEETAVVDYFGNKHNCSC